MKARVIYVILAGCLCLASAGAGQNRHPLVQIGGGPIKLTPEQKAQKQALQDQVSQLDRDAAMALHKGRYAEAEADERESMALQPYNSGVPDEQLAAALDGQGKTQEALQAYKSMADAGIVFPRDLLPYALLLLKTGQWSQAVATYDKALKLLADAALVRTNSDFSPAAPKPTALATAIHIGLGLTYNAGGDWAGESQDDRALTEYKKALELEPESDLANYYYGYGLKRLGRRAEAKAAFAYAAQIGSDAVKKAAERAAR